MRLRSMHPCPHLTRAAAPWTARSHVMHISSTVNGKLADALSCWDALQAALPAGTVSGAPKARVASARLALCSARRALLRSPRRLRGPFPCAASSAPLLRSQVVRAGERLAGALKSLDPKP